MKKISKVLLHTIQHICLVGCAFALVMALLCSTVFVEDRKGKMNDYDINTEPPGQFMKIHNCLTSFLEMQ